MCKGYIVKKCIPILKKGNKNRSKLKQLKYICIKEIVYTHTHIHTYVCVCVCIYIYIYIYIYTDVTAV